MPRNRLFFTAPIVLAIVIIGVFAIRSRGDNHNANLDTGRSRNCPPIARADVAATKPGTPISIDVLANDTDPDGDPLVFQIRKTSGGESTVDDGGTPTDAGDDRVQFTPDDPAPPSATIDYQALDPEGALSESTVTVYINADGALPADARSEAVPTDNTTSGNRCGTGTTSTSTSTSTTEFTTESPSTPVTDAFPSVTAKTKATTTTRPKATTTTKPHTSSTTQPHNTTTTHQTTTTQPSSSSTTQPDTTPTTKDCGPKPDPQDEGYHDWYECTYGR